MCRIVSFGDLQIVS